MLTYLYSVGYVCEWTIYAVKMVRLRESVTKKMVAYIGVGRIFSRGWPAGDFSKILLGGAKSGEICFFPLEIEKTTFLSEIFKIQGAFGPCPPFRRPWLCIVSHCHSSKDRFL